MRIATKFSVCLLAMACLLCVSPMARAGDKEDAEMAYMQTKMYGQMTMTGLQWSEETRSANKTKYSDLVTRYANIKNKCNADEKKQIEDNLDGAYTANGKALDANVESLYNINKGDSWLLSAGLDLVGEFWKQCISDCNTAYGWYQTGEAYWELANEHNSSAYLYLMSAEMTIKMKEMGM